MKDWRKLRVALAFCAFGALMLALESARERLARAAVRDDLELTFANVVDRVRDADVKLQAANVLTDDANLTKARSLALLLESDPSLLTDSAKLDAACRAFDADEVCVSDENGVLVACSPKENRGYDMKSSRQSAAFVPAISDKSFSLAQKPQPRGADGKIFQYAGVARLDKPGIVQVGVKADRLAAMQALAGQDEIARTSRVRRGGFLRVEPVPGDAAEDTPQTSICEYEGRKVLAKTASFGGHRVSAGIPLPMAPLASAAAFAALAALSAAAFLALLWLVFARGGGLPPRRGLACGFACACVAALLVAFEACRERGTGAAVRGQLLLELENAAARVRASEENRDMAGRFTAAANLAKARTLALLVAADPGVLADAAKLERAQAAFELDEMQVSDGKGVVVAAVPKTYVGYDLSAYPQSAEFLPAISDKSFSLAQKPQPRGVAGELFQYAGVARLDGPGVVRVGAGLGRVDALLSLAGVAENVNFVDFRHGGFVDAVPKESAAAAPRGYYVLEREGRRHLCLSTACGGTRVTVGEPAPADALSHRLAFAGTACLAALLFLCLLGALLPETAGAAFSQLKEFGAFFWGLRSSGSARARPWTQRVREALFNPVAFACFGAFLLASGVAWSVQTAADEERAREMLVNQVSGALSLADVVVENASAAGAERPDLARLFGTVARKTPIGRNGFLLCTVAETGEIVANGSPKARPDDTPARIGFNADMAPREGAPFMATFYSAPCLAVWRPYAGFRVYAVLPMAEITQVGNALGAIVILFVVFVAFAFFATRLISLVSRLKTFIAAEKDRVQKDMAMATTIQRSSLPVTFPDNDRFKIFALMDTAREVGGDFYDFADFPDGRELFLIADVSGKGVPAALFMMKAKATIRAAVAEKKTLSEAITLANDRLAAENDANMFVTAWIGLFDPATGVVEYVNAGHNLPIVKHADGSAEWVSGKRSLVLAAMDGVVYKSKALQLKPGDSLLLYTDGVTEAVNPDEELYGDDRLLETMRKAGPDFVTAVRADVDAFANGAEQADDITLIALDYKKA
ncbi:MAG: serine/threonine-protein phosphatase [Kiritimatiellae bacterium]|nr:serine/threonine-protein phosphatase [Kiritimatiellia bacterium]